MTKEVQQLLKKRNTDFKSGNKALYSVTRTNRKRGIRRAKREYRKKIEDHLDSNNTRKVCQGVQHLTNYRTSYNAAEGDVSIAEELNHFFARFEVELSKAAVTHAAAAHHIITPILRVEEQEVRCLFQVVNPRKAADPDGIPGRVLRNCTEQLTRVFNLLLSQSVVLLFHPVLNPPL